MNFNEEDALKTSVVDGILDIDKLISCNDFNTIKKGLNNYPLNFNEYLNNLLESKKYKELFEYSINNDFSNTSYWFLNRYGNIKEALKRDIFNKVKNQNGVYKFNYLNEKYFKYDYFCLEEPAQIQYRNNIVKKIIGDISLKIDKETLTKDLNKEYFEKLYNDKNYELLVIKLCVRLEAVLKCDFHYVGTFEEMLSQYSSQYGYHKYYDDDWSYDEETESNKIFHKLRKYRNDIVHPEKQTTNTINSDQLKLAIDLVLRLG